MLGLALLILAGGGAVTPWDGELEPGKTYVLTGENDPEDGHDLLEETFKPPTLKLPHHHASSVQWVGEVKLPRGKVRLVFKVESREVERADERRWNSNFKCRVISAVLISKPK